MKAYLVLLIAFFSIIAYSQEKSIVMHKKNSERTIEIEENKRIQIVTVDGKKYFGRFKVIDPASIQIDGDIVPLNSIIKMKRKSTFGTIAKPVVVTLGIVIIPAGLVVSALATVLGGPASAILGGTLISGATMITVPLISNNHPSGHWEYSIKYNNESSPTSNEISLGKARTEP